MEKLIHLASKRYEVGKTQSYKNGGNFNDYVEYARLGEKIVEEVDSMHKGGKLSRMLILPFEIGEKVFIIKKNTVVEDVVADYDIWSLKCGIHLRIKVAKNDSYIIGVYGEDVFRTKEEAEAKKAVDIEKKR